MMRKAEFTFRDLTVRYLYDVPAQADAYLPMILYIPDSSLDHGYEKFISAEFQRNHPCSVIVPEVIQSDGVPRFRLTTEACGDWDQG